MSGQPTSSAETEKKLMLVRLKAKDGEVIELPQDVAFQSDLLKRMIEDLGIEDEERLVNPIPITTIDGKTLKKIFEWCTINRNYVHKTKKPDEDPTTQLTKADNEYMNVSSEELIEILKGANFLNIGGIVDIITQKIANMVAGKNVVEMREIFGLVNDFTPEEEEEIRKQYEWIES